MRKRVFLALVLIVGLLSLLWLASSQSTASKSLTKANPSPTSSVPSKEAVSAKLATLERGWVKNEGQWDERALFSAPGYFGNTWITKDGELLHVAVKKEECKDKTTKAHTCPSKSWVISERWVGGKVQAIKGEEELQTKVSYFIGNDPSKHRSNLSTYRYVSLGEVWSGVEVKLKATQKTVEKLFYVQPGADPSKIQVQVDGAKGLKLSKDGEIIIKTGLGELKMSKPVAWQEKDGKKLPVEVSYKLLGKNRYSFEVAKADPSLPIVIDPLLASTFIGGRDGDIAYAIALDSSGNVYVTGWTSSFDYPATSNAYLRGHSGGLSDVFVSKLSNDLRQLLASTFIGGSRNDEGQAIAIDSSGNVYVTGYTTSSDYPTTTGAYDTECGTDGTCNRDYGNVFYPDVFVSKLSNDLRQLLASTFIGGSRWDIAYAIALDSSGNVYVTGYTYSSNYPTTSGAYSTSHNGGFDVFVSKLSNDLGQLLASTFIGGRSGDIAYAIALDSSGNVYVAGETSSSDYPTTSGAYDRQCGTDGTCNGDYSNPSLPYFYSDVFVSKLSNDLRQLLASTFIGGSHHDYGRAIAIDSSGNVYVTGYTRSSDYPTTTGAYDTDYNGGYYDVFISKLSNNLTQLLASTFIGGRDGDIAYAIALDSSGNVYVTGWTSSSDYPATSGAYDTQCGTDGTCNGGRSDVFVSKLSNNLTQLLASTFIGGSNLDEGRAIALDSSGNVYVAGRTYSSDYPTTSGAYDRQCGTDGTCNGSSDVFVSKLNSNLSSGTGPVSYTLSISPRPSNGTVSSTSTGINCGSGGSACSATFTSGSTVTLTATPSTGYTFAGWTGDCLGCGTSTTCTINMDADKICSANFTASGDGGGGGGGGSGGDGGGSGYTLSISPTPTNGTVTSSPSGINCGSGGSACSATFTSGSTVTLTATPSTGYTFAEWGGDCSVCGTNTTCDINMNANKTCFANFIGGSMPVPPTLSVVSSGYAGPQGGVDFGDAPINTQKVPAIIKIESANRIFISDIRIIEFSGPLILQGIKNFFRGLFGLKEQEGSFILDLNAGDRPCGSKSFILEGYCTVGVIFQPKSEGKKQAYLEIYYEYIYLVQLYMTGTGVSQQQAPPPGGSGGSSGGGGGGGCSMTGSASSPAGFWNILVWLSVPAFALARRIRRR